MTRLSHDCCDSPNSRFLYLVLLLSATFPAVGPFHTVDDSVSVIPYDALTMLPSTASEVSMIGNGNIKRTLTSGWSSYAPLCGGGYTLSRRAGVINFAQCRGEHLGVLWRAANHAEPNQSWYFVRTTTLRSFGAGIHVVARRIFSPLDPTAAFVC